MFTESEAFDRFGLAPGPEQVRIDREQRQEYTANYLGDVPMDDPLTSPAHASVDDFVGVCPLLFLSADEDVSLDDAVRCAKIAQQAGCSVDLVVWPRVWHDWILYTEGCGGEGAKPLREAEEALRLLGVFMASLASGGKPSL